MARTGLTKVEFAKFQKIATQLNLVVVEKGGWTKFYAPGTDVAKTTRKPCIAVPNTAKVTIVEVVNFTSELAVAHPKPSAKTVTGMIDFAQPEGFILRAVFKLAKQLVAIVPVTVAEPVAEVTAEVVAEVVAETEVPEVTAAEGMAMVEVAVG